MNWRNILSGFIGALILILLMLSITVWLKPFDYQAVYILNPKTVVKTDTLTCNHLSVLKDMESKGILLTPEEYTSHISSYYSTLVAFLIGLFVLFSFISFFSIRNTAQKDIEEAKELIKNKLADDLKESISFNNSIISSIQANLKNIIITKDDNVLVDINAKIKQLEDKQKDLEAYLELVNETIDIDSKSEIKE